MSNEKLLKYFNGDSLAADVWKDKYAQDGEETPDDMHRRLAKEFSRIEDRYHNDIEIQPMVDNIQELSNYGRKLPEMTEDYIYNLFKDFKYIIPQGSIMSQLGANSIGSLSNCFVVGQPSDSYGGILHKDEQLAQLMKRRGGVGIDISTLRPKGLPTSNAAKTSTGAISFMERFSNTTREVAQEGRRGALMITIDVRHPDVLEFINIKRDKTKVTGANISVSLRDDFMEAVKKDEDYILRWPCNLSDEYPEINDPRLKNGGEYNRIYPLTVDIGTKEERVAGYIKKVKAREIYDSIVDNAWDNAEPGQIFIDKHWEYSPDGIYPQYKGITTNPCGEIFMQPYDACRLIAINLFSFIDNPFTKDAVFNREKFYEVAYEAMRLSDDLIDLELEHIDKIINKIENDPENEEIKVRELSLWRNVKNTAQNSRRTGLGFTALGDMFAALNIKYGDQLDFLELVMNTKMQAELDCTIDLAILRGTFGDWDSQKEFEWDFSEDGEEPTLTGGNRFYQMLLEEFPEQVERMREHGRRNVSWSTVAPTGTVSLMSQTTSGLEPLFMPFYMRRKKVNAGKENVRVDFTDAKGDTWQEFPVVHPRMIDWYNNNPEVQWNDKDGKMMPIDQLSKDEINKTWDESPWFGSTANDIDWMSRLELQSIIQKYTTHSISSTINLPNDVSKETVSKIYLEAHNLDLKGVTIYRDGCRDGVLVSNSVKEEGFVQYNAPKRPKELPAEAYTVSVKGEPFVVIVGLMDDKPYEVFAYPSSSSIKGEGVIVKQKKGEYDFIQLTDSSSMIKVLTDVMSDEQSAITRMISTALRHGAEIRFVVDQLNKSNGVITSFSKAIARTLKRYIPVNQLTCSDCHGTNIVLEEGCSKCKDCGSSKCG